MVTHMKALMSKERDVVKVFINLMNKMKRIISPSSMMANGKMIYLMDMGKNY